MSEVRERRIRKRGDSTWDSHLVTRLTSPRIQRMSVLQVRTVKNDIKSFAIVFDVFYIIELYLSGSRFGAESEDFSKQLIIQVYRDWHDTGSSTGALAWFSAGCARTWFPVHDLCRHVHMCDMTNERTMWTDRAGNTVADEAVTAALTLSQKKQLHDSNAWTWCPRWLSTWMDYRAAVEKKVRSRDATRRRRHRYLARDRAKKSTRYPQQVAQVVTGHPLPRWDGPDADVALGARFQNQRMCWDAREAKVSLLLGGGGFFHPIADARLDELIAQSTHTILPKMITDFTTAVWKCSNSLNP